MILIIERDVKGSCDLCQIKYPFIWMFQWMQHGSVLPVAPLQLPPDVSKDLLLFIFPIKGVACNLQTACARIIFSISSARLLIPLWGLFSAELIRPVGLETGAPVATETPSPGRPACQSEAGWDGMSRGRRVCVCSCVCLWSKVTVSVSR